LTQLNTAAGVELTIMSKDQELWDLLARSPRPAAPPFFAAKVLRQIESPVATPWLSSVLRWLAPTAVAALVFLAVLPRPSAEPVAPEFTTLDLIEMLSPEDHEVLTQAGWPYNNGLLSASL
jgi:hypothetical protein